MNCKEFEHWLCARPFHKNTPVPDAVCDHINLCTECNRLFRIDKCLDAAMDAALAAALESEKLPHGLYEKIELALNHAQPDHAKPPYLFLLSN